MTSYLTSFHYFVHPPGVASTAKYRELIDRMYINADTVVEWPHTSDE